MNFEFFIAKRLLKEENSSFSKPIVRIATLSIALSIAVMIVSVAVLGGFKKQIREKITGFTSHIHISPFSLNNSSQADTFSLTEEEKKAILSCKGVKSLSPYIMQAGVVKSDEGFHGIVIKGVEKDFDTSFFKQNLCSGRLPDFSNHSSNEALISKTLANKLNIKTDDKLKVYFYIDMSYRVRPFKVVGIYETGLGDYDNKFIISNAGIFQKLYGISSDQYSGYEVCLDDFSLLQTASTEIYNALPQDKTISTIEELEPGLFSWLGLLDTNVILIIIVMTLVTIITASSTLLIMVFEQSSFIGLLKSFGTKTASLVKIYLYKAAYIVCKAMIIGNVVAVGVISIQSKYHLIKLNQEDYYLDSVPMELNMANILAVNLAVVVISMTALLIPARSIGKVSPVVNIRKD